MIEGMRHGDGVARLNGDTRQKRHHQRDGQPRDRRADEDQPDHHRRDRHSQQHETAVEPVRDTSDRPLRKRARTYDRGGEIGSLIRRKTHLDRVERRHHPQRTLGYADEQRRHQGRGRIAIELHRPETDDRDRRGLVGRGQGHRNDRQADRHRGNGKGNEGRDIHPGQGELPGRHGRVHDHDVDRHDRARGSRSTPAR